MNQTEVELTTFRLLIRTKFLFYIAEYRETRGKSKKIRVLPTRETTHDLPITYSEARALSKPRLGETRKKSECHELGVELPTSRLLVQMLHYSAWLVRASDRKSHMFTHRTHNMSLLTQECVTAWLLAPREHKWKHYQFKDRKDVSTQLSLWFDAKSPVP